MFDAVGGANEDDGGAATDDQAQITSLLRQLERIVRIPNVLRRPVQYLRPRTGREESESEKKTRLYLIIDDGDNMTGHDMDDFFFYDDNR